MAILVNGQLPCILFEDDHLLVVNKPSGMNTHSPSPFAGEGIYEFLKNREPRWSRLAIVHRLDKDTSGVMVFTKTAHANRSVGEQFATRKVQKTYLLLVGKKPSAERMTVKSYLARAGDRYISRQGGNKSDFAETTFTFLERRENLFLLQAEPFTGRTHQIRVHAADQGLPIIGDPIYGGGRFPRLALHAHRLRFRHPTTGVEVDFRADVDFVADPAVDLRNRIIPPNTNTYRIVNGATDRFPGWYLERWGDNLLSMADGDLKAEQLQFARQIQSKGLYHKQWRKTVRGAGVEEAAPRKFFGDDAPNEFFVLENGLRYKISFQQGYSVGLFLDQRENRRKLLTNYIEPDFPLFRDGLSNREVLNTFAYTCGFSVCAAKAGAKTTSLDLSKKYLDWGKENFQANGLDPAPHDFIFGDVFEWLERFRKKIRSFDVIILDPPTFSQSKQGGSFQAEKDYGRLAELGFLLLKKEGVLFCSTNAARLSPEDFVGTVKAAAQRARRQIGMMKFMPQPPDFPMSKAEPGYLKTLWIKLK